MNFRAAASAVLGREAVRMLDQRTIAAGTPARMLMESAGQALAAFVQDSGATGIALPAGGGPGRLLVLAGSGNNGGDGFVAARVLAARGWDCVVALAGSEPAPSGGGSDAAHAAFAAWRSDGGCVLGADQTAALLRDGAPGFDLAIDAVFGTGLARAVQGVAAEMLRGLNRSGLPVVAADLPSGLCADTGRVLGTAVLARATLAFGAAKPGLFLREGPAHAGRTRVADIALLEPERAGLERLASVLDESTTRGCWPRLPADAHKGTRGHVLVVAGSRGKAGAAVLAARGALRAGAGLVTVAAVPEVQAALAAALPEAMSVALEADADGRVHLRGLALLDEWLAKADAVVAGPGLGGGAAAWPLVERLLAASRALVLDADALNAAAAAPPRERAAAFGDRRKAGRSAPVLTPHPGEMARLARTSTASVQDRRDELAAALAAELGSVVLLKGPSTIVASGTEAAFNLSGSPSLATAGSGDVLAGLAGAALVRVGDPFEAACVAAWAHGRAGELAGPPGILAHEVADCLPLVLASRCAR